MRTNGWHWGDTAACAIGLYFLVYAWGLGGTPELLKIGIIMTLFYLVGRGNGTAAVTAPAPTAPPGPHVPAHPTPPQYQP